MKTADLSNHNLAELKRLHEDIALEIKSRQQQEVQKAREQILAIAQSTGLSISELLAGNEKKAKKLTGQKLAAQYQNPGDNSSTWTGRGVASQNGLWRHWQAVGHSTICEWPNKMPEPVRPACSP